MGVAMPTLTLPTPQSHYLFSFDHFVKLIQIYSNKISHTQKPNQPTRPAGVMSLYKKILMINKMISIIREIICKRTPNANRNQRNANLNKTFYTLKRDNIFMDFFFKLKIPLSDVGNLIHCRWEERRKYYNRQRIVYTCFVLVFPIFYDILAPCGLAGQGESAPPRASEFLDNKQLTKEYDYHKPINPKSTLLLSNSQKPSHHFPCPKSP